MTAMAPLPSSSLPLSPPSPPRRFGQRPSTGRPSPPSPHRLPDWREAVHGAFHGHGGSPRSRSLSPSATAVVDSSLLFSPAALASLPPLPPFPSHPPLAPVSSQRLPLPPPPRRRLQRHVEEVDEGETDGRWAEERREGEEEVEAPRPRRPAGPSPRQPRPSSASIAPSASLPPFVRRGPSPPTAVTSSRLVPPLPVSSTAAASTALSDGGSGGSEGSGGSGEGSDDSPDLSSLSYPRQSQPRSPPTPPLPPPHRSRKSSAESTATAGLSLSPSSALDAAAVESPSFPPTQSTAAGAATGGSTTRSSTPTSASSRSGSVGGGWDDSDPDTFTARHWHSQSAACLLRATEAVDVCCHAIVATNGRFHHSSSVTLESRRLALTVAVFERSLYAYALRISSARQAQQRAGGRSAQTSSNASSTNTTPTFAPSLPAPTPVLPSLYSSHAPFVPQQGDFTELGSPPSSDWSSLPLSYQSTIPSSSAHSLAASAMASSSRLQQHTAQQHSRFLHSSQTHSARYASPQLQSTSTVAGPSPSSFGPSSSSAYSSSSPLGSAFPSLSISPMVSSSFSSPSSPIPPTVPMLPSQWVGGYRGAPPPDPASIPSIAVQTPLPHSRGRTFSATSAPSSHPQAPVLLSSASYALSASISSPVGPSTALSVSSPHPRSASPVEVLSSPHLLVPSPQSDSRSLLPQPLPSAPPSSGPSSAFSWHQPAGMSCLLRILTHQLLETRAVLLALNEDCSSFPRYLRHLLHLTVSAPPLVFRSVARHPQRVMVAASVASMLSLLHSAPPLQRVRQLARTAGERLWGRGSEQLSVVLHSSATAFLLSFVPPSIRSSLLTVFAVLSPHVIFPQLRSAVHTRAAFTIIPLCLFIVYRLSRYRRVSHLRSLHSRLGLLLRLWHICFSLLGTSQPSIGGSGAGGSGKRGGGGGAGGGGGGEERRSSDWDDDQFVLANREAARVPISRWLLELVPPELDASFWYHSTFRLSLVKYGLDVLYSSVQEWYRLFGCRSVGTPYLLLSAVYFACQPHLAASTASRLMASPDIEVVRHAWRLLDTPIARRLVIQALPAIAAAPHLAVCKEIELCDVDESDQHRPSSAYQKRGGGGQAQSAGRKGSGGGGRGGRGGGEGSDEEDEGRFEVELSPRRGGANGVLRFDGRDFDRQPSSHRQLRRYQRAVVSGRLRESLSSLDEEADLAASPDPTLKLLLLSSRPLRLTVNLRFHRVPSHSHVRSLRPQSSPVLLYFHGGGFFTDFRASHLHFLSQWATELDVPILYVDYSLAPDNAYPTALNECYDTYRWVVEGRLGVNASHIVLVGDSTGGNLAAAVCMKAIQDQIRIPDAVILACPILNLRLTPTPSRSLYMMDAVLPMNLLLQCLTGDHRVLTREGWKSITRVKVGDEVMSFNIDTYAQEWREVTDVTSHPVDLDNPDEDDELYRMEGSGMDVVATRNHRMLTARLNPNKADRLQVGTPIGYETVGELLSKTYTVQSLSKHSQFARNQQRAVVLAGTNVQSAVKVVIPDLEEVCEWWWQKDQQVGFLQFLGFWLGDGCLDTGGGYVCISQTKKEGKRWLETLLDEVFPRWWKGKTETTGPGQVVYRIRCPPLYEYLRLMAVGPIGYNPRDTTSLRNYPHFALDSRLAAAEQQSPYYVHFNTKGTVSRWTEAEMLAALTAEDDPGLCYWCRGADPEDGNALDWDDGNAGAGAALGDDDPEAEVPRGGHVATEDEDVARKWRVAGKTVWWKSGWSIIIGGHWFYLKRWMGNQQQIRDVYSQLSRTQAVALLEGFCRAEGTWESIKFDDDGEPTGCWRCGNSSFPLLDHLQLIAQLAGAAVTLCEKDKAGSSTFINGRVATFSVCTWTLLFHFTKSARGIPFQYAPLAEPVHVSGDVKRRGNYQYRDDRKVYCLTVKSDANDTNANFLTQRLSMMRLQSNKGPGMLGVRAHSVFVGNCRSLYLQGSSASNDADIDPCLSPIVASDWLLRQWPVTSIMVGGYDPFVDDSVDFAHRLSQNGVHVRLRVYDQLPHSFLDFAPLLPQAQDAVNLAATWIRAAFHDNNRDTETQ